MDIFIPIAIFFILFALFSLCGICCKRRRDQGAVIATPVVITSAQHHVGQYPAQQTRVDTVSAMPGVILQPHNTGTGVYPMPQPMPGYNATPGMPYPPQGYQQQQQMAMPMPMPMQNSAPPMAPAQSSMNPPSYDQVVSEGYAKQAPFNPHYTGQ